MKKITFLFLFLFFFVTSLSYAQMAPAQPGVNFSVEYSIVPVKTTAFRYPDDTLDTAYIGIRGQVPYGDMNGGYLSYNQEFHLQYQIKGTDPYSGVQHALIAAFDDIVSIPSPRILSKGASLRLSSDKTWIYGDIRNLST